MHADAVDAARPRQQCASRTARAARDAAVRDRLVAHLQELTTGSDSWSDRRRDEFVGSLKGKPGLRRYLRRTKSGLLRVDAATVKAEAHPGRQVVAPHQRCHAEPG